MTRITGPSIGQTGMYSWIKANQTQIERHPAWCDGVDEKRAELLLEGKNPLVYLLRTGEEAYYVSFVKRDGAIKHQRFTLEYEKKGWYYRNGFTGSVEVTATTLEDLIPMIMRCSFEECQILRAY